LAPRLFSRDKIIPTNPAGIEREAFSNILSYKRSGIEINMVRQTIRKMANQYRNHDEPSIAVKNENRNVDPNRMILGMRKF